MSPAGFGGCAELGVGAVGFFLGFRLPFPAGKERPAGGDPAGPDHRAVQDRERVPGLPGGPDRVAELGSAAASRATVSVTYRHAVAVSTANPAATCANGSPLRRCTKTSNACWPGFSFRYRDPIEARCQRMIPAVKERV